MRANDIVKRALELKAKRERHTGDPRYKKVIGFLKAKGLLFDDTVAPEPNVKLDVKDVLWVGQKVEPRVLEVFPAAFIHFTRTFLNASALPEDLKAIIEAIRLHHDEGEGYNGIEFKKMKYWAAVPLKDHRVKPLTERKIPKNFRLSPAVIKKLRKKARSAKLTETEFLERLIRRA